MSFGDDIKIRTSNGESVQRIQQYVYVLPQQDRSGNCTEKSEPDLQHDGTVFALDLRARSPELKCP